MQGVSVQRGRTYYIFRDVGDEKNPAGDECCYIMCQDHYRRHRKFIKENNYRVLYTQRAEDLVGMRVHVPGNLL